MITEQLKKSFMLSAIAGTLSIQQNNEYVCDEFKDYRENLSFNIPLNWKCVKLSDITNYGKNKSVVGKSIHDEEWILELEDIEKNTSVLLKKVRQKDRKSISNKNKFGAGDLLYGKLRPYLNKCIVADEDGYCSTEIVPMSLNSNVINKYLQIVLMSPYYLNYVNEKSYGTKMPRLGTKDAQNSLIPLPPIEEQQRIVDKIEQIFTKIDEIKPIEEEIYNLKNNFVIQIKRNILVDEIISIDKKIALENYMDTKLKEGWKWVKFSEVADCRMGKTILGKELTNCGIPVYSATNTNEVFGFVPDAELILNKGDIVIPARGNSIGYATFINDEVATCTQTTIACKPKKNIYNKYLYYCCYAFKNVWFKYTGSAIPQITISKINKNYVPLPPFEQQKKIVERLEKILPLCDEIEKLIKGN